LELRTRIIAAIMLNIELSEMELNRLTENNPHIKKVIENLCWFGKFLLLWLKNKKEIYLIYLILIII